MLGVVGFLGGVKVCVYNYTRFLIKWPKPTSEAKRCWLGLKMSDLIRGVERRIS